MAEAAPDNLMGLRDRALLLIGFAAALRRSELVGLDVADLKQGKAGLRVRIRGSKTDQERQGATVAIAPGGSTCPIAALNEWLAGGGIDHGPVFRPVLKGGRVADARLSDRAVAEIVKTYARRIGLDPKSFSGHSLRAGFFDLCRTARRIDIQDDGCLEAPQFGYAERIHPRLRVLPRSSRCRSPLITMW